MTSHGGKRDDISIYGQESNPTTWRLAAMNLAIRGLAADLGKEPDDTFGNDQHPDTKFDYIIANPPLIFLTGVEKNTKMIRGGCMVDLQ